MTNTQPIYLMECSISALKKYVYCSMVYDSRFRCFLLYGFCWTQRKNQGSISSETAYHSPNSLVLLWRCQLKYKWVIMNLQKNVRLQMVKLFALFVKKKRSLIWGFYKLAKKLFFEFQKVWNHITFFFFPFWGFFRKTEKKKTQFSFSNCKKSQFCASKKKVF